MAAFNPKRTPDACVTNCARTFLLLACSVRQVGGQVDKVSDTAPNTFVIGKYRLDPVAEFEGPRMQPPAMFTKTDPQHLARLLERTPAGSYDKASNQLFTSVHTWLVRDDAGMVLLVDSRPANAGDDGPGISWAGPLGYADSKTRLAR